MSPHTAITAAFLDRILALLAPLFLAATGGDMTAAREAADAMLANYNVQTDDELRLVALTIAFGFGALDALGQATNPALSFNQVMRLRTNATALSRAGHQNQAIRDRLHKQSAAKPAPEPEPATLPTSAETADLVAFVRSANKARCQTPAAQTHAPQTVAPSGPLSRQQRRAAERQAEKAQRRREHEARQAALRATRAPEPFSNPHAQPD
jgi:hypothetical protein